jgi:hypothetical protein
MINDYKFFYCIFNMYLFWNVSTKSTCHKFEILSYKYMKTKQQLELLYLQVDEGLMCMDIVSTFHILVIIYQSFNIKIFWKI